MVSYIAVSGIVMIQAQYSLIDDNSFLLMIECLSVVLRMIEHHREIPVVARERVVRGCLLYAVRCSVPIAVRSISVHRTVDLMEDSERLSEKLIGDIQSTLYTTV